MHHIDFLQDLSVVLIVAAMATILFRQLKQPVVLGYILAGVIIGPHTPPFQLISNEYNIETLAELGVIFLMFTLGLEFSFRKLKKVGATASLAAILEIIVLVWAGYEIGGLFGWGTMDRVFLGAILAISSTTIIIKALEGLKRTKEKFAELIFGILIIEDILGILLIALLSGFAMSGEISANTIGVTLISLGSFLGFLIVVGLIIVPRLLNYVAKFKSNEMLLIAVIGLCFGVSLLTVKLGYSVALGAFIIGAIIAEARQIKKIETLTFPVRDLFSAVFFVSIGLIIDPSIILQYGWPIVIITMVVLIGKIFSTSFGTFLAGNDSKTSLRVGMGLSQIGEFSFIIASLGLTLKVTSDFLYPIVVAVSAITTFTTPYLIQSSDSVINLAGRIAPAWLTNTLTTYSSWVGQLSAKDISIRRKVLRKVILQISINILILIAIFSAFIFLQERIIIFIQNFLGGIEITKTILWLITMILSFPVIFAIWRKVQALGMIIAELSVSDSDDSSTIATRSLISNTIFGAGTILLIFLIAVLSSTMLPSQNLLILSIALVIIITAGFFLYRSSNRLYGTAQAALKDTFAQVPDHKLPQKPGERVPLALLSHGVKLEPVEVKANSSVKGKLISEIALRTTTGVSIIAIERKGESIVNPEIDEEIEIGDILLLLGDNSQLEKAKEFILPD